MISPLLRLAYSGAARLAQGAAVVAPPGDAKVLRSLRARRGIGRRYREWANTARDASRPLVWMHAPSVGEGLQARPVLEELRRRRPDAQLAYTFFSPSAERFAASLDVDFADFLPFDTTRGARLAIEALRPRVLAFSKLDVWPTLVREAHRRGVRLALVSGTLAEGSGRRSSLAASLLREAYGKLDAVGAIDRADGDRLIALGARPAAVHVTGDTRYDQVWAKARAADRQSALLAPLASARPTLVAGSTWPSDEEPLFIAWREVRGVLPDARLIIAPHEPIPAHLENVRRMASRIGARLARLGSAEAREADIVLVDRLGVLGELYALADVAFVGGGFHDAGLHSVLEPAAFGAPVVFGPRHESSRDARLLLSRGGAGTGRTPAELTDYFIRWLRRADDRRDAGERARALVRAGLGAADRSVALIEELLA